MNMESFKSELKQLSKDDLITAAVALEAIPANILNSLKDVTEETAKQYLTAVDAELESRTVTG